MTHPSTLRRFEAVARAADIGDDEMKALITEGLNEAERYPLPTGIEVAPGEEGLIFTSRVKQKSVTAFTFSYLIVLGAPPAIFSSFYEFLNPTSPWLAMAAFAMVYGWMIVTMMDRAGQRFIWKLRERLRKKLIGNAICEAWFVGLSPHGEARVYEGSHDWDLGYVELKPGEMLYAGEQTKFSVSPIDVRAIKLVSSAPRWRPDKVILVEWRDTKANASGAFRLSCPSASISRGSKSAQRLFETFVKWREAATINACNRDLRLPVFPEITSTPSQKSGRQHFSGLILASCLPFAISISVGEPEGKIFRVLTAMGFAFAGHLFATIPFWRKPRIFEERIWL